MKEKILICSHHPEYKVPLLWTFAFAGSEYWCPYCGTSGGMFGTGTEVNFTEALYGRQRIYEEYSDIYLQAYGYLGCSRFLVGKDEDGCDRYLTPKEMPGQMIQELTDITENGWQYGIKATALLKSECTKFEEYRCVQCYKFITCKQWKHGLCTGWVNKKDEPVNKV